MRLEGSRAGRSQGGTWLLLPRVGLLGLVLSGGNIAGACATIKDVLHAELCLYNFCEEGRDTTKSCGEACLHRHYVAFKLDCDEDYDPHTLYIYEVLQ